MKRATRCWQSVRPQSDDNFHTIVARELRNLTGKGFKNLHLLPGSVLLVADGSATGDGLHPNAVGMTRYADAYEPVLREILSGVAI